MPGTVGLLLATALCAPKGWGDGMPTTAAAPPSGVRRLGRIVFPADPRAVLDVKRDLGAKGDGVADDTEALQAAIERSTTAQDHTRSIYLPAGTYRITRPLVFRPNDKGGEGSMVGPWIWGEERDRTIIRLDDGAEGYGDPAKPREAIRGVSRPDGARMNADFFDRTIVNLTLDTGNNPGAIGIKYYSNNTGVMRDVLIRGNGAIGLDLGSHDQNGPCLIQNVEIDGFAVGIRAKHMINSQTLSDITVRNAREVGLRVDGQTLAVERLRVIGAPLAVECREWAIVALVDSLFEHPATNGPAVKVAGSVLHAQRLHVSGYSSAVVDKDGKVLAAGPDVAGLTVGSVHALGPNSPESPLGMQPEPEPVIPYPTDTNQWVCANDFGAALEQDLSEPLQKAIDAAAARGASTVYLLGGKRGDPNWYFLQKAVRIHGSVNRVMGFGFVRIIGGGSCAATNYPANMAGRLVVDDDPVGAKIVVIEHLKVFAPGAGYAVEARSPTRTAVFRDMHATILVGRNAKAFVSNACGHLYQEPGSTVWMRQWNTEGGPAALKVNTRNDGGRLWVLGLKTEAFSTKVQTLNGGRTEVLGVHNYNTHGAKDDTPFFQVKDASLSVGAYREVCFFDGWWKVPVLAQFGGQEFRHPQAQWQNWGLLRAGGKQ